MKIILFNLLQFIIILPEPVPQTSKTSHLHYTLNYSQIRLDYYRSDIKFNLEYLALLD